MGIFTGIGKELGIDGAQGEYFQGASNAEMDDSLLKQALKNKGLQNDPRMLRSLLAYSQGKQGIDDSMWRSGAGNDPNAFAQALATNPLSGSKFATDQVRDNEILGQLFGKGGALERVNSEEQNLASQGFQLTPEDHQAYGQASNETARLFGQEENSLAQALAGRGMASAPNGAAGVGYSGLMGNKTERLASAQRKIADDRMKMNQQRLESARGFMSQMGAQGQAAIQDQFGRNMAGVENAQKDEQRLIDGSLNKYSADINRQNASNQAALASQQDKRGAKGKTLGEAFGAGMMSSAYNTGASPGTTNQSFASSFGSSLGSMTAGGMSDRTVKKNIEPAEADVIEFLSQLGAHSYEYKNPKHGAGRYVSPMAQELEKTKLGKSMVVETPEGKMVDYARGFGVMLSAMAVLARKLEKLGV